MNTSRTQVLGSSPALHKPGVVGGTHVILQRQEEHKFHPQLHSQLSLGGRELPESSTQASVKSPQAASYLKVKSPNAPK